MGPHAALVFGGLAALAWWETRPVSHVAVTNATGAPIAIRATVSDHSDDWELRLASGESTELAFRAHGDAYLSFEIDAHAKTTKREWVAGDDSVCIAEVGADVVLRPCRPNSPGAPLIIVTKDKNHVFGLPAGAVTHP